MNILVKTIMLFYMVFPLSIFAMKKDLICPLSLAEYAKKDDGSFNTYIAKKIVKRNKIYPESKEMKCLVQSCRFVVSSLQLVEKKVACIIDHMRNKHEKEFHNYKKEFSGPKEDSEKVVCAKDGSEYFDDGSDDFDECVKHYDKNRSFILRKIVRLLKDRRTINSDIFPYRCLYDGCKYNLNYCFSTLGYKGKIRNLHNHIKQDHLPFYNQIAQKPEEKNRCKYDMPSAKKTKITKYVPQKPLSEPLSSTTDDSHAVSLFPDLGDAL